MRDKSIVENPESLNDKECLSNLHSEYKILNFVTAIFTNVINFTLNDFVGEKKLLIKKLSCCVFFILMLLNLTSCSDSPTSFGSALLGGNNIYVKKLDSISDSLQQHSTYFKTVVALGNSTGEVLGKNQSLKSSVLLNFNFTISGQIYTDLDSLNILSAYVKLIPYYKYGDSTANLDFNVYKILQYWTYSGFTSDSLSNFKYDVSDVSSNRIITDTLVTFNINTTLIKNWLYDYKNNSSSNTFGIYLTPTNNSNRFIGFYGNSTSTYEPEIVVVVQKQDLSYQDTLYFDGIANTHVVEGNIPVLNSQHIAVQNGLTSRSKLWFDVSKVPFNAVINSAIVTLTLDTTTSSFGTTYTDGIYGYVVADSVSDSIDVSYTFTLTRTNNQYIGNAQYLANKWLRDRTNLGIIFTSETPLEGLELFSFFGSQATNINQRPRLTVTYSVPK
jgi:hypothetical protein